MVSYNSADIEYLGTYVTQITYYEPWNELVQVRHEERYVSGRDSDGNPIYSTRVWYTTEVRNHKERYTYKMPDSHFETSISKETYDKMKKRLNSKPIFKDMKRRYHTKDGDAWITVYDGSIEHMYDITYAHRYKNKIKASQTHTIFRMEEINEETAKKYHLYDYPKIKNDAQIPILGRNVSDKDLQMIRYINATRGKSNQFRMYMLFFNEDEFDKSEQQKAYWQNGNKNEFVVCLGMKNDSVAWVNAFSWCDMPKLEIKTRNYFISNPILNIYEYGQWLNKNITDNWQRKEFKDFKYINVELSKTQSIWLLVITIIFNLIVSALLIFNRFNYDY